MRIERLAPFRRLVIDARMDELEVMRSLPIRRWDKVADRWLVPMVEQNLAILRGRGVDVDSWVEQARIQIPAHLDSSFELKTDPRQHQHNALLAAKDQPYFGLFMDPGTGKSKILIDDAVASHNRSEIDGVLLLCPNSIKGNWVDELSKHHGTKWTALEWEPGRDKRLDAFIELGPAAGLRWFIVGLESMSSASGLRAVEKWLNSGRRAFLVDESSRIKTHDVQRTKNIIELSKASPRRRIATGTPATQGPHNLWSQFEALHPGILDLEYYPYRGFFCRMGGYKMKAIVGEKNKDVLLDLISPYVFQARKADCLNLPPKTHIRRVVEPTKEQARLYNDLLATGSLETSQGMLTFDTALVRDLRLHQLTGGFVATQRTIQTLAEMLRSATDPGALTEALSAAPQRSWYEAEPIPGPNPKIEELKAILDEFPADAKFVIWSRYRAEIEAIANALEPYGKAVQFHGGVAREDRDFARRSFQEDPEVRFFVGQIQTGGIGITLTAASVEVFFSNDWSAENRIQAEDRIHRIGQEGESCLYIDLLLRGPYMDRRVINAVQAGMDYHVALQAELAGRIEKNYLTEGSD